MFDHPRRTRWHSPAGVRTGRRGGPPEPDNACVRLSGALPYRDCVSSPEIEPFEVTEEVRGAWASLAAATRVDRRVLDQVGDPIEGSDLQTDDRGYRWEKCSAWVAQYLGACLDHLELFANTVQPLQQFEGMTVRNPPRAYFTLARAATEAAAQALWILEPDDTADRVHRHLRLLFHDLRQFELALRNQDDPRHEQVRARMKAIGERTAGIYSFGSIKSPEPRYLDMIRDGALAVGRQPDELETLWRGASAAAHGKNWFQDFGARSVYGEEYESGYYRMTLYPDVDQITSVVQAATDLASRAVGRFTMRSGYDPTPLLNRAMAEVAEMTPVKPGMEAVHAAHVAMLRARVRS